MEIYKLHLINGKLLKEPENFLEEMKPVFYRQNAWHGNRPQRPHLRTAMQYLHVDITDLRTSTQSGHGTLTQTGHLMLSSEGFSGLLLLHQPDASNKISLPRRYVLYYIGHFTKMGNQSVAYIILYRAFY